MILDVIIIQLINRAMQIRIHVINKILSHSVFDLNLIKKTK